VAKEPVAEEPVAEEPVAEEPVAEEPVAEEPVAEEPVAKEPVAKEPVAKEPVEVAPFGMERRTQDEGLPGSFFGSDPFIEDKVAHPGGEPDSAGEDHPALEWGVSPPPVARHRRNTRRSFAKPLGTPALVEDPFGADEPTPVSLIEDEAMSPSPLGGSRPGSRSAELTTSSVLDPIEEDSPPTTGPRLRAVYPRPAVPGVPRRRAMGVPPPLPRGGVEVPEVGAISPSNSTDSSQSPLMGLDDLLSSDEVVAPAVEKPTEVEALDPEALDPEVLDPEVLDPEVLAAGSQEVVIEAAPPSQSYEDIAREFIDGSGARVETMVAGARELYDQGTFEGSLWLCQKILKLDAEHGETLKLLKRNQEVLLEHYNTCLGDLSGVPKVQVSQGDIVWHKLDHRAGFLISRIDGMLTYDDILDISGMDRFEAMRILAQLVDQGVLVVNG
ncbi:MAG: hypothetical protein JRH20_18620, partial [Deltaproteobacteria bacterium]|nr:hypothetical protein [Deltaproteobacteria bacterium]